MKIHLNIFLIIVVVSMILCNGCTKKSPDFDDHSRTYNVDLDGDSRDELVKVVRLNVKIFAKGMKKLGEFKLSGMLDRIEFTDLNRDRKKQIVVWGGAEEYSKSLRIYALRNGRIENIFKIEYSGPIETNFNAWPPEITTGWESWLWNGKKFVQ